MLYIVIPSGYKFFSGNKAKGLSDRFEADGKATINIQAAVQEALTFSGSPVTVDDLEIHEDSPLSDERHYLEYLPSDSGKAPSKWTERVIGSKKRDFFSKL